MIDHIAFPVKDYARSLQWYLKTLKPLDYKLKMEIEHEGVKIAGLGEAGTESIPLWIWQGTPLLDGAPDSSSDAVLTPVEPRPCAAIGAFGPTESCHICLPVPNCRRCVFVTQSFTKAQGSSTETLCTCLLQPSQLLDSCGANLVTVHWWYLGFLVLLGALIPTSLLGPTIHGSFTSNLSFFIECLLDAQEIQRSIALESGTM